LALLEYIKDQLLFNDSVTLPGLGSFEISKRASVIKGNKISPPTSQIIFNPEKSLDDGSLAKVIADAEEITQDEAAQKVLEYIDQILFALNKGEEYIFEGFGTLSRDSDNVLRFTKEKNFRIDYENYGLESFELDPLEDLIQEEPQKKPVDIPTMTNKAEDIKSEPVQVKAAPTKEKREITTEVHSGTSDTENTILNAEKSVESKNNRSIFWILTGAVMVILVSFIILRMTTNLLDGPVLTFLNSGQNSSSELFPEDENWDVESDLNTELGDIIDSMTAQENALVLPETAEPAVVEIVTNPEYEEFHIIAGSFKDKVNAGILQKSLTEQGYPALVIQQGDHLYRVSAVSFKDKEKGLQELSRFKQKTRNNAAWLLRLN